MSYSEAFKARMVQKMTGPRAMTASELSGEIGVCQPTLSRWLRDATRVPGVTKKKKPAGRGREASQEVVKRRPQDWKPQQKLEVVLEAAGLSDSDLGEFLRRRGLHEAQLTKWREQLLEAAPDVFASRPKKKVASAESKRIRELERELRRKEKALAEAAALIVLKKKADAIWGDEEDD